MAKALRITDGRRCIGCLSCRQACARLNGEYSPSYSAIDVRTTGGLSGDYLINICRACEEPACREACKFDALTLRSGGGVILNKDKCTQCKACTKSCSINAIALHRDGYPIVCKHCGYCSKYCPHNCIGLEEVLR